MVKRKKKKRPNTVQLDDEALRQCGWYDAKQNEKKSHFYTPLLKPKMKKYII